MDVGSVGYDRDSIPLDAIARQNLGDGAGYRDDRPDTAVLPSCSQIAAQMEVNTPRCNERYVQAKQGQRTHSHGMCRVGMDDLDSRFDDSMAQRDHGARIAFECRRAVVNREYRLSSTGGERLSGPRGDQRVVATALELHSQPERLTLTATPSSLGIDV